MFFDLASACTMSSFIFIKQKHALYAYHLRTTKDKTGVDPNGIYVQLLNCT